MFCPTCGTEMEEGALFCGECGTKLEQETQVPQMSTIPQRELMQQQNVGRSAVKSMDKKMLIGVIEMILLVILVFVFFSMGRKKYSPQAVAERFCQSVVDNNASAVYDELYVDDDTFIKKEMFVEKNVFGDEDDKDYISKLAQIEAGATKVKGDIASVEVKLGIGSINDKQTVVMKKSPQKKFLFFDTWKVVNDDYLNTDFSFTIPAGATATFDGVALSDKYKTDTTEEGTVYMLPQVISGLHDIELDWGDIKGLHMYVSSNQDGQGYTLDDVSIVLDQDEQKDVLSAGYDIFQKCLTAQINKSGFDDIKELFLKENQKDAKGYFEEDQEYFYPDEYNTGVKNVKLSNVKGAVTYYDIRDGKLGIEVSYSYNYDYVYVSRGWFDDKTDENHYDGNDSESFTLVFDNGKWKLAGAYVPTL